jgi:fructosamine-3-kinase
LSGRQSGDWRDCFGGMISDLLDDARDMNINLPYDEIKCIVAAFIHACGDVKTPKLVHWDLWAGNVLIHNKKISGVIDFERSLYADILMEHFFRKFAVNNDFNSGYGIDFSALDKNAEIRLALYDLYLALIWIIEFYYRKYDQSQLGWREEQLALACKTFGGL